MVSANELSPFVGGVSFVNPATWQGVMRQVSHLAQFSGGLHVIDGVNGSGKTVFAHHMAASFSAEVGCGVLALPAGLPTSQVFDCLLTALEVDVREGQSIGQSIIALRQFNTQLKQSQTRKILIIDDAHHLSEQALAALASVFQGDADSEVGLAIIFLAEPGLAQRLDALNLIDVEVRDCVLPKFSVAEAKELLMAEFAAVYVDRAFPFDEEFITALWAETDGRPGPLLRLAQDAWDGRSVTEPWWRKLPVWHIAALCFLLVALAWGVVSSEKWSTESSVNVPAQVNTSTVSFAFNAAASQSAANSASASIQAEEVIPAAAPLTQEDLDAFQHSGSEVASTNQLPQEGGNTALIQVMESSSSSLALSAPAVPSAQKAAPALVVTKPVEAKTALPAVPAPKPPALEGLSDDERALMNMADKGFVLQVLAANSRKSLEDFVVGQANRANLRIYRSLRAGKSWYVVVEGFYADKDSALAAMSNLPNSQLKAGPWPKSIVAVKLEIAAFKQQAR